MAIEAKVCRESGRELSDPNAVYLVVDFAVGRVAVIDKETIRSIPQDHCLYETPFTEWHINNLPADQIGVNIHHTEPAGQAGLVVPDDYMFSMERDQVISDLPNVAVSLGYIASK
jgi:hypothetical protein